MMAKEEFYDRTGENPKHRGTNHSCEAVARREPGMVAAGRDVEAQTRRARPLQAQPFPRLQARRRSRERQRHTHATRHFTDAMAEAHALGANARVLAGLQNVAAIDPRNNPPKIEGGVKKRRCHL